MKPYVKDCANTVRARGFRFTPQRQFILDAIHESRGHITPDEIYSRVRVKLPTVNRATVYRNVDFLCEMRLLVAAQIGRQMYYEIADREPHHHLVCRNCNHVAEVSHDTVKNLFQKINRIASFQVDMDHLVLFGLCEDCQPTHPHTSVQEKSLNTAKARRSKTLPK